MVEFVSLFLGALIAEPKPVELRVHQDVAAVEIRLDARVLATLRDAPWELEVDFGGELVPHLLEAVAYSREGREIGRAKQWVNLTPQEAGITLVLDRDPTTRRVQARLSWQSLSGDNQPVSASATFDGEALEVTDPSVIALPPHDPDGLHHLRVELEFAESQRTAAELVFGGRHGDTVSTELTAFPVDLEPRRELPDLDGMQSWIRSGGEPLRVHAVEKGLAEIVVVRSPPATRYLSPVTLRDARATRPILRKDHRLRFVGVNPTVVVRERSPFVVFPRSAEIGDRTLGLRHLLSSIELPDGPPAEARLCDAVAVAGALVHRSARRRAVVLITSGDARDASRLHPEQVRTYLSSLGVPLVVWNPRKGGKEAGRWGAARNVSTDSLLDNAYRELSRGLDRQRIVWLNGLHLPQTLVVDPDVEGVRALR